MSSNFNGCRTSQLGGSRWSIIWEICERVAEVRALLDDHVVGGKHSDADVVAKAQVVLSEPELLRALRDSPLRG